MWSSVTLMISSPLSEALARKRAWPHITPSDRKYLSNRREYELKVSSSIVRMMTSLLHHPSCTINSIPISRTVPTAKPPPVVSMCFIHEHFSLKLEEHLHATTPYPIIHRGTVPRWTPVAVRCAVKAWCRADETACY